MELEHVEIKSFNRTKKSVGNYPVLSGDKGVRALKDVVIAYQANERQGNAKAKNRSEVSGTGKKPWRQKGTGMARHGSRRSPLWHKGGVAHGPRQRDYTQKINKKVKRLALKRALFDCASEGRLTIVDNFDDLEAKTKVFQGVLDKIYSEGHILVVDEVFSDNVILSARNIRRVYLMESRSLNALDILYCDKVIMTERGLADLLNRLDFSEEN